MLILFSASMPRISYRSRSCILAPSSLTQTLTQRRADTGRRSISKTPGPRAVTFSIPTAAIHIFPRSYISYDVIVRSGNTTERNSKDLPLVCGEYCCLFAPYMDRGYTPQQFLALFAADDADRHIHRLFRSEFGLTLCKHRAGGQCCTSLYKR